MLSFLLLSLVHTASAQEPAYDKAAEPVEEVKKPETDLSAELGFLFSSGNSWNINVNGGMKFGHKWGQNQLSAFVGANLNLSIPDTDAADDADGDGDGAIGTANDEANAGDPFIWSSQRAFGGVRYDRFIGDKNALYISFGGEHDQFAGLIWRFNEQFGYRRIIINNETTKFDFEGGLAYNEENFVEGVDADGNPTNAAELDAHYLAARIFFGISHQFNDIVSISDTFEAIEPLVAFRVSDPDSVTNFEDFRFVNTFAITTKLSDRFSLKVSDRLAFDNQPTSTDYAKVDNTVMLTLVASIL